MFKQRKAHNIRVSVTYFSFLILFHRLFECSPCSSISEKDSQKTTQVGTDDGTECRLETAKGAISKLCPQEMSTDEMNEFYCQVVVVILTNDPVQNCFFDQFDVSYF